MKLKAIGFSVGLLLAASVSQATAADWIGGMKDFGGGTPVPAPIPVPIYHASWYLRGDIGVSFGNDPDISTSLGGLGPSGTASYQPAWYDSDFGTDATYGIGVGYVWSSRIRTDVTVDYHPEGEVKINGSFTPAQPWGNVSVNDKTTWDGVVTLFNAYWDMGTHSGFTPYIGAGIGFSWNQLRRVHSSTYSVCGTCADAWASDKVHDITLAYALTAGVSYDMGRSTYLDFNYRYVWIEGTDVEMGIGGTNHTVSIGDLSEHQLRAGIRYMID